MNRVVDHFDGIDTPQDPSRVRIIVDVLRKILFLHSFHKRVREWLALDGRVNQLNDQNPTLHPNLKLRIRIEVAALPAGNFIKRETDFAANVAVLDHHMYLASKRLIGMNQSVDLIGRQHQLHRNLCGLTFGVTQSLGVITIHQFAIWIARRDSLRKRFDSRLQPLDFFLFHFDCGNVSRFGICVFFNLLCVKPISAES